MLKVKHIIIGLMAVIAVALTFSCNKKSDDVVVSEGGINTKALPGPVQAIHTFNGEECVTPPKECGSEVIITANLYRLYLDLGDKPRPRLLPTVLTDHIYVGHLNDAIAGNLDVSLVYNRTIDKLFVVFRLANYKTAVFVYPFTN